MNEFLDRFESLFESAPDLFTGLGLIALIAMIVSAAFLIFYVVVGCCLYKRAGKPGVAFIIPIWNTWCLFDIVYGHGWLMFIPGLNVILSLAAPYLLAKVFSREVSFIIGIAFLPIVFLPILAFSPESQYEGALFD